MAVRIGFVGTGGNALGHMRRLSSMEDVTIAGVADVNEEAARKAGEQYGAPAFNDARKLFDSVELDGVYISIPPFAHGEPEWAALEKNLAMYVEKPVHLDIGAAREIAAEIDRRGLIATSGFQERYIDIIDRAKSELSGRQVGLVMGYWMGGVPRPMWWRKKAMSGGQAVEQTIHVFDMARYLIGEVARVQAVSRVGLNTHIEGYDIEDASAANLVFENGAIGTIFSSCFHTVEEGLPGGLDIFCPDATFKYTRRKSLKIVTKDGASEWTVQNDYAKDADRAFVEAIKHRDRSRLRVTYREAVKSLELVLAVNKAMETGQTVTLPL